METLSSLILRFRPLYRSVIWGGDAIAALKGVDTGMTSVGESWELSALPGSDTVVTDGPLSGLTLGDLSRRYGAALLGHRVFRQYEGRFPLLVKIIDAERDLSLQVHPDDTMARSLGMPCGKTEMWYILDTRPGARIYDGLSRPLTPETYDRLVADGTIMDAVASYASAPGDIFFIPAGTMHAIGAGNLLLEIQQSSDVTYRVYDYGRRDADGNLRTLHIAEARAALNYTDTASHRLSAGALVACPYFTVRRHRIDGTFRIDGDPDTFTILFCADGACTVTAEAASDTPASPLAMRRGDTLLVPAAVPSVRLTGDATVITARS